MPHWPRFKATCIELFEDIKANVRGGKPADYIPKLGQQDPEWFSMSVCTVDGQRFDYGDTNLDFSIQSCIKPFVYALGVETQVRGATLARARPTARHTLRCAPQGLKIEHKHVGIEPSGLAFNEVELVRALE